MRRFFLQLTAQAENLSYGHLSIIAHECGFSHTPFLNGHLQHGWNGTDGFERFSGKKIRAKKFVWSKRVENQIISSSGKNVIAIGAPWLYLLKQKKVDFGNHHSSSGVIAYPDHSQPWAKLKNVHYEYSLYLQKEYGPCTVSLHWSDYSVESIRIAYEDLGHKVFTNGVGIPWLPDFNSLYLEKQLEVLSKHRYFVSNVVNTAAFYAMSLGMDVMFGGPAGWTTDITLESYYGKSGMDYWVKRTLDQDSKSELWQTELGLDSLRRRDELLKILEWDSPNLIKRIIFLTNRSQDLLLNGNYREKLSFATK